MKNFLLFSIPSLIWGSTWLAIKFQLGVVDPLISIFYRFLLAAVILLVYCRIKGKNLKYSGREHLFMLLLGLSLFGVNYWLVYMAELTLTSGLVAICFSTITFLNIFNGAIFLKSKIRIYVLVSSIIGFAGVAMVFKDEILNFTFSGGNSIAFFMAMVGAVIASLGNITSAYTQKHKMPVIQSNAFGMLYGALSMFLLAMLSGKAITFDFSTGYILSLLYLAVFGSVIAFTGYLTLLGKIGADKSGYVALVIPIIALILSTVFEGYQWSSIALLGVFFIILGNVLVLRRKKAEAEV